MAVKHVTIYECDVCKAHVGAKELKKMAIGQIKADICDGCVIKVAWELAGAGKVEVLEQPHHTR